MIASLDRQWWEIYVQVPESLSEAASEYLHGLGSTAVVFHEQAMLTPQHTVCIETRPETTAWTVLQGALPLEDTLSSQVAALQQWLSTCADATPDVQLYCQAAVGRGLSHAMAAVLPTTLHWGTPHNSPPMGYLARPCPHGMPHTQSRSCFWDRDPS